MGASMNTSAMESVCKVHDAQWTVNGECDAMVDDLGLGHSPWVRWEELNNRAD